MLFLPQEPIARGVPGNDRGRREGARSAAAVNRQGIVEMSLCGKYPHDARALAAVSRSGAAGGGRKPRKN